MTRPVCLLALVLCTGWIAPLEAQLRFAQPQTPGVVESVKVIRTSWMTVVRIATDGEAGSVETEATRDGALEVTLPRHQLGPAARELRPEGGLVSAVELSQIERRDGPLTRVSIRTRQPADHVTLVRNRLVAIELREPDSVPAARRGLEAQPPKARPAPREGFRQERAEAEARRAVAAEIRAVVEAWAAAWSAQDVERYLSFYAWTFRPRGGQSREDWTELRRSRLSRPETIQVSVSALEISAGGDGRARASFLQEYASNLHRDTVRKTLELIREDGSWKILEERVES